MKQIKYIFILMAVLTFVSCSEDELSKSDRIVRVSVSMPDGESTTRVGVNLINGSKDLSVSFREDDEFSIYVRQGEAIGKVENVIFSVDGNDGKKGTLTFEMPGFVNTNDTYTLYGICGVWSRIRDGRLIIDGNGSINLLDNYQAPIWFNYTGAGASLSLQCQYIGTFIVLHFMNKSNTDFNFQIWGLTNEALYDDLYWDENTKTFSEYFGVACCSEATSVSAGKEGVFIYNGIPNGKIMEDFSLSIIINPESAWGQTSRYVTRDIIIVETVTPTYPKPVGKILEQGKAYHVYLTWDGQELYFGMTQPENTSDDDGKLDDVPGFEL